MPKIKGIPIVLSTAFLVSCSSTENFVKSLRTDNELSASPKFTYKIENKRSLLEDETHDAYMLNGEKIKIAKNQIIANFYHRDDEEQLEGLVSKFGGKIKKHLTINTAKPTITGSKEDGTARAFYPEPVTKFIPVYLIDLPSNENEDVSDLADIAQKAGIKGEYVFPNARVASFLKKIWKLNEDRKSPIFSQDASAELMAATAEGYFYPDLTTSLYEPTDVHFWWCNTNVPSTPKGANINSGSEKIWDYATGQNVKVGVIDLEFQGDNEAYMPVEIVKQMETIYYGGTGTASGFKGFTPVTAEQGRWHGRQVSSLIFAPNSDARGTVGTAPNARPYLYKSVNLDESNVVQCYAQAVWDGCKVINMSFGKPNVAWSTLAALIADAGYYNQTITVASAGNNGDGNYMPLQGNYVIGVSATDNWGNKANFSQTSIPVYANSWHVDIWAPGKNIAVATYPASTPNALPRPSQFVWDSGTSFAAPIVAGVVACMVEKGYATNFNTAVYRLQTKGYPRTDGSGKILDALKCVKPD